MALSFTYSSIPSPSASPLPQTPLQLQSVPMLLSVIPGGKLDGSSWVLHEANGHAIAYLREPQWTLCIKDSDKSCMSSFTLFNPVLPVCTLF